MRKSRFLICQCALVCSLLLAACGNLWGNSPLFAASPTKILLSPSLTPFQPEGFTPAPADTPVPNPGQDQPTQPPQPTLTPVPASLWISPAVPENLRQFALASGLPSVETPDAATERLEISNQQSPLDNQPASVWIYALVAPFPTLTDDVSLADIQSAWAGTPSGPFAAAAIYGSINPPWPHSAPCGARQPPGPYAWPLPTSWSIQSGQTVRPGQSFRSRRSIRAGKSSVWMVSLRSTTISTRRPIHSKSFFLFNLRRSAFRRQIVIRIS